MGLISSKNRRSTPATSTVTTAPLPSRSTAEPTIVRNLPQPHPSEEPTPRVVTTPPPPPPREAPEPVSIPEPAPTLPIPSPIPIENVMSQLSLVGNEPGTPVYTLSVTDQRVCLFVPTHNQFLDLDRAQVALATIEEGRIYHVSSISRFGQLDVISSITDQLRRMYTERRSFVCPDITAYRQFILPALLLGSRVRDFEQRCARVEQMDELTLNMPAQWGFPKKLKLKTILGATFELKVKSIQKNDTDRNWIVTCYQPEEPLPSDVKRGSLLEIVGARIQSPRVTDVLMSMYTKGPSNTWPLLSCIYGEVSHRVLPALPHVNPVIHLSRNAEVRRLNPEQVQAVARYNSPSVPAFVIEAPPGSGKTMTAAAMAVKYEGKGVQLFLSTANVPVSSMALELAKFDYGSLKIVHFMSSEFEGKVTDEARSPFSVLSLAKSTERLREKIERLEEEMGRAPNDEERRKVHDQIQKECGPIFNDAYDVYFATIDMILGRLSKPNARGRHQVDATKKRLETAVERVVIDEASQLTEAALNALIDCFPKAQFVLIGDSKQLAPFKYAEGDIVSELAARSALEVIKDKHILPVIKLRRVYRASHTVMVHYNNVFYGGRLVSEKPEPKKNPLRCLGRRAIGSSCLFWQVKGYTKQRGTSKVNLREIYALSFIVRQLRQSKIDEKDVMVISYYEAQRKEAETELKKYSDGYEVLTVDSAQGREKRIVIVLTTRTSSPAESGQDFFTSPKRCNVALSRHQEAVIVLGHPSLASSPTWTEVLDAKYFKHVDNDNRAF